MSLGMVLAAVLVPIICGLAATFIVTRVQRGMMSRSKMREHRDDNSDL